MKLHILDGRVAVLAHARLLEQLAERCEQYGSLSWLGYFLSGHGRRWKRPCVVLFLRPDADTRSLRSHDLIAAALFYQLGTGWLRTGVYSTDDWSGRRTVVAPVSMRGRVAVAAADALYERGAHLVLTTYQCNGGEDVYLPLSPEHPSVLWAEHVREVHHERLTLSPTYEETLNRFGKQTRFNFRYYRKRLIAERACEFVPEVYKEMSESELLALNAGSLNPASEDECLLRYRSARDDRSGFLIGLRAGDGTWLSLLGGWRQGPVTVMRFQINAAGYEKASLNTVMRAYFMETEIERGTRTIVYFHGINHPMTSAFDVEKVRDLVMRRKSLMSTMYVRLASRKVSPRFYSEAPYFKGSTTFFAAVLVSDEMKWRESLPVSMIGQADAISRPQLQFATQTGENVSAQGPGL